MIANRQWLLPVATTAAIALMVAAQWRNLDVAQGLTILNALTAGAFVGIGLLLVGEETLHGLAPALVCCGLLWTGTWSGTWDAGPAGAVAITSYALFWWCFVWGMLRYPGGRLESTAERVLVMAGLAVLPPGAFFFIPISRSEWWGYTPGAWWFEGLLDRDTTFTLLHAWELLVGLVAIGFGVLIWRRYRRVSRFERRILGPAAVALIIAVGAGDTSLNTASVIPTGGPHDQHMIPTALAVLAPPVVFGIAALRRRLTRGRIALLLAMLPSVPSFEEIRGVLRVALDDPTAQIYLHAEDGDRRVDVAVTTPEVPPATPGRLLVALNSRDGSPLATIAVDEALEFNRDSVDITVKALAVALESLRQRALAETRLAEVVAVSARVAQAAFEARRRLERDLRDGAQRHLLTLDARLGQARRTASEPDTLEALDAARDDLAAAFEEIRRLAAGLYPGLLARGGLPAALQAIADSLPLAVTADVCDERFSQEVEVAVYFTVCEALTNAVKHADASTAAVTVARDGHELRLTVTDNGRGGASVTPGGGLAGLADRLCALNGTLDVHDSAQGGTTLTAALPLP